MERKIGEIFEFGGEWYQCVEGTGCYKCDFNIDESTCIADNPHCTCRSDKKDVISKKLKKAGEPFSDKLFGLVQKYELKMYGYSTKDKRVCFADGYDVFIKPKQTKEDMGEYKMYNAKEDIPEFDKVVDECLFGKQELKLKPFDLQKAKEGKPVCTRDGRKARIICFDKQEGFPIIALVETKVNDRISEGIALFNINGRAVSNEIDSEHDLMMLSEKRSGWVNVYKKQIHNTFESAEEGHKGITGYIKTIKVEWEE